MRSPNGAGKWKALSNAKRASPSSDGQQHQARHLDQRLRHAQPAAQGPDGEPDHGLGEGLDPEEAAAGGVLEQARREAGQAAELRASPQREEHHDDQRDIGRDVADPERRGHGRLGDASAEDTEGQEPTHPASPRSGSRR